MFISFENNEDQSVFRKIIVPVIVILLCLVSMIGVTWALFTNGEDGKIGVNVTSGSINIDIIDEDDKSLLNDVLNFVTKDGREVIYFEPGATIRTEGFRVKNEENSISINYRICISNDENEDMAAFAEAFELWITKDPTDLSGALQMPSFTGSLKVDEVSEMYYLVIRMKENAGNEFQGKEYTGIGITVIAVQGNVDIEQVNEE